MSRKRLSVEPGVQLDYTQPHVRHSSDFRQDRAEGTAAVYRARALAGTTGFGARAGGVEASGRHRAGSGPLGG